MRALHRSLAVLLVLLPMAVSSQTPGPVHPPGGDNPPRGAFGGKIKELREKYKAQRQQLRDQIERQRGELSDLIARNAPAPQTHAKLRDIVSAEGQLEDITLQEYYDIRDQLPPDKQAVYTDRVAQQVRRERRHAPGQGPAQGVTPTPGPPNT